MSESRSKTKWACSDPLCAHVRCLEYAAYAQSELHETEMSATRRPNDDKWDWSAVVRIDGTCSSENEAKRRAEVAARRLQASIKA